MTAGRLMIGDISIWATLGEAAALRLTYDRSPYISNQPMPTEKPTSSLHDLFGEAAPRPASGAEVVQVLTPVGLDLSYRLNLTSGATIILVAALAFFLASIRDRY